MSSLSTDAFPIGTVYQLICPKSQAYSRVYDRPVDGPWHLLGSHHTRIETRQMVSTGTEESVMPKKLAVFYGLDLRDG